MNAKEVIHNGGIKIDFDSEIIFNFFLDSDKDFKKKYAVEFMLEDTPELVRIVDDARVQLGHLPCYHESVESEYDESGWYNFYYGLITSDEHNLFGIITAVVVSDIAEDNGHEYFIDVLYEDKPAMREIIDKQFRERYNKSIEDLLKDSKDMMEIEHCACEAYLF